MPKEEIHERFIFLIITCIAVECAERAVREQTSAGVEPEHQVLYGDTLGEKNSVIIMPLIEYGELLVNGQAVAGQLIKT